MSQAFPDKKLQALQEALDREASDEVAGIVAALTGDEANEARGLVEVDRLMREFAKHGVTVGASTGASSPVDVSEETADAGQANADFLAGVMAGIDDDAYLGDDGFDPLAPVSHDDDDAVVAAFPGSNTRGAGSPPAAKPTPSWGRVMSGLAAAAAVLFAIGLGSSLVTSREAAPMATASPTSTSERESGGFFAQGASTSSDAPMPATPAAPEPETAEEATAHAQDEASVEGDVDDWDDGAVIGAGGGEAPRAALATRRATGAQASTGEAPRATPTPTPMGPMPTMSSARMAGYRGGRDSLDGLLADAQSRAPRRQRRSPASTGAQDPFMGRSEGPGRGTQAEVNAPAAPNVDTDSARAADQALQRHLGARLALLRRCVDAEIHLEVSVDARGRLTARGIGRELERAEASCVDRALRRPALPASVRGGRARLRVDGD